MAKDISKKDLAAKKARRAQKEMLAYMEENDLDPKKDWTGHKKHGKKIQAWVDIINLGNKKARAATEEKAVEKAKKNQKPEAHPKKKEKVTSTPNAYDYPTVDGKEMTSDQKKKYRQKMRTLLKTMSKEKAEAEGKKYAAELASGAPAAAPKKEESAKEKKADKPSKEGKDKKKKKKKKTKKEED